MLKSEIAWQRTHHLGGEVPRLVCVQGLVAADGSKPLYRHPTDHALQLQPMSTAVDVIRQHIQTIVGHSLNHVLIQLYRSGQDYISEHSDKTLDIVHGSSIVNVSLGAQRTMRLRTKRNKVPVQASDTGRDTQLVPLPHASMFVLGPKTNAGWLHGISADKRRTAERQPAELAYGGERISLTFRFIGTFIDGAEKIIWGQGAKGKHAEEAQAVVNGDEVQSMELIRAFGTENQSSGLDWQQIYGAGSNVLHFKLPDSDTG